MRRACPICRERNAGCWADFAGPTWVVHCATPDAKPPKWYRPLKGGGPRRFVPCVPPPRTTPPGPLPEAPREPLQQQIDRLASRVATLERAA